jgi:hypothetical protein
MRIGKDFKMMKLKTTPYLEQKWPTDGRHILAQYDQQSIIVYQAYRPSIGQFAARHGYFGDQFRLTRMSWIKPNFLWMMYRSDWGTKWGQEVTLAIRIKRQFFETILEQAVPSSYDPAIYENQGNWKQAVESSTVRLQWDPDHDPSGAPLKRRAIQLGLSEGILEQYARDAIIEIMDISDFVESQRIYATKGEYSKLLTPTEQVYLPENPAVVKKLKLSLTDESLGNG